MFWFLSCNMCWQVWKHQNWDLWTLLGWKNLEESEFLILELQFLILGFEILSFEIRISDLESEFLIFSCNMCSQVSNVELKTPKLRLVNTSWAKKLEESEFLILESQFLILGLEFGIKKTSDFGFVFEFWDQNFWFRVVKSKFLINQNFWFLIWNQSYLESEFLI